VRVLVTATEGCLGYPVAPGLFEDGHDVVGHGAPWRPLVHALDIAVGAAQLHRVSGSFAMDAETFHGRGHTRRKQIEYLLKIEQVDECLFWRESE
jgi:hypothetical protein